ncbi:uncharacterized protein N7473_007437 [Penicillium subrubescens]|uniref:uncharacterized protein n=1 Tax=Penicillium subrubescens TaxID=1316194 RepID=UPI0025454B39|nr:uncharacterized protein N7473_007437 [Penicillium subrubescens]KAJ5891209.1 hypothetical protein N7473_007437 [Penicillium subrubescens]
MPALPSDEYDADPSTPESQRAEELQLGQLLRRQSPEDLSHYENALVEAKPEVGGILESIQVSDSAFPAKIDSKLYPPIFKNSTVSKSAVKEFRQMLARYNSRRRAYTALRPRVKKLQPTSRKFMVERLQPLHQEIETLYSMLIPLFGDNINEPKPQMKISAAAMRVRPSLESSGMSARPDFGSSHSFHLMPLSYPQAGFCFVQAPFLNPPTNPKLWFVFRKLNASGQCFFAEVTPLSPLSYHSS